MIKVQKSQTRINEDDFDDILATGSIPSILNFMRTKNIVNPEIRFDFGSIYWLCKDATFYKEGLRILKAKGVFDPVFWSFSLMHNDLDNMREYFSSKHTGLKAKVGAQFQSTLLEVNDNEDAHDIFNFLDYYPLVNARAHRLGGMDSASNHGSKETKQWILNDNLRDTYKRFMLHLVAKRHLSV